MPAGGAVVRVSSLVPGVGGPSRSRFGGARPAGSCPAPPCSGGDICPSALPRPPPRPPGEVIARSGGSTGLLTHVPPQMRQAHPSQAWAHPTHPGFRSELSSLLLENACTLGRGGGCRSGGERPVSAQPPPPSTPSPAPTPAGPVATSAARMRSCDSERLHSPHLPRLLLLGAPTSPPPPPPGSQQLSEKHSCFFVV